MTLRLPPVAGLLLCACSPVAPLAPLVPEAQAPESSSPSSPTARQPEPAGVQLAQYPGAPFEDRRGDLWFSTVFEGLIRYDGTGFVTFTKEDGLAADSIRDILEDDEGVLWVGTTGGLSRYDGESFTTLTDYGDLEVANALAEGGDHRDIWDVHFDRHGTLWIATADGAYRRDGSAFVPFPMPVVASGESFEFTPRMVYCIFEASDGVLWFGTDGAGAVSYDGTSMRVYTADGDGLCSDRICVVLEDSRGDLWFGTSGGGVSRYDGTAFTTHLRSPEFSIHTGWGRFMDILEDRDGDVWFGVSSAGGGVYRYDGEAFEYLGEEDGLGRGGVPDLSLDRDGNLWLGTTSGVYRHDGERFVNFTRGD